MRLLCGLVNCLTSAQVMISQFMGSGPTLRSLLPTLDPLSPSLCPSPTRALSLKNKHKRNLKQGQVPKQKTICSRMSTPPLFITVKKEKIEIILMPNDK